MNVITKEIPKASQVTMNMSSDPNLPCVIEHTVSGIGFIGLYSAHLKRPKESEDEGRKASESTSNAIHLNSFYFLVN